MNWVRIKDKVFLFLSKFPDEFWYCIILLITAPMENIPIIIRCIPIIGIITSLIAIKMKKIRTKLILVSQISLLLFSGTAIFFVEDLFWTILLSIWVILELMFIIGHFKK